MTVYVEYSLSEEITEEVSKRSTFREVEKVCFENIFNVFWVCCDDGTTVSEERNCDGLRR